MTIIDTCNDFDRIIIVYKSYSGCNNVIVVVYIGRNQYY